MFYIGNTISVDLPISHSTREFNLIIALHILNSISVQTHSGFHGEVSGCSVVFHGTFQNDHKK